MPEKLQNLFYKSKNISIILKIKEKSEKHIHYKKKIHSVGICTHTQGV